MTFWNFGIRHTFIQITAIAVVIFSCSTVWAQQYVDAPIGFDAENPTAEQAPAGESFASIASGDVNNQLSTGIFNYSLLDPIYKQFTGYDDFDDSRVPLSMFVSGRLPYVDEGSPYAKIPSPCITWIKMDKTGFDLPPSWAYGVEFLSFSSTTDSAYSDKDDATAPDVDMSLYIATLKVRVFFMDAFEEAIQPYFEVGWGTIFGTFESKIDGKDKKTNFYGLQTSRVLGTNVAMSPTWGFFFELRTLNGKAKTSNDPYNQGDGDSMDLDIDGSITTASVYYRY